MLFRPDDDGVYVLPSSRRHCFGAPFQSLRVVTTSGAHAAASCCKVCDCFTISRKILIADILLVTCHDYKEK
jgi:hypothetical protein